MDERAVILRRTESIFYMSRSGKTQQEDEVLKLTIVRSSGGKAEVMIARFLSRSPSLELTVPLVFHSPQ